MCRYAGGVQVQLEQLELVAGGGQPPRGVSSSKPRLLVGERGLRAGRAPGQPGSVESGIVRSVESPFQLEPGNVSFVVGVRDVFWTNPHLPNDDASFVPNPRASVGFVSNIERE